jgi:hypothetical protein
MDTTKTMLESTAPEPTAPEPRTPESRTPEPRTPEPRAQEAKSPDSRVHRAAGPEGRYASLNRSIEVGQMDEKSWAEMAMVCVKLGKREEALHAYRNLSSYGPRKLAHTALVDRGWLRKTDLRPDPRDACVTDSDLRPTFLETAVEGFEYLIAGRMPLYAMVGTIAFGLLLVLGGVSAAVFGGIGAGVLVIPVAVALYGGVWAVARRVLVESCRGFDDPPDLPVGRALFAELRVGSRDTVIAAILLFGPAVLIHWLVPIAALQLAVLSLSWGLFPLLLALRRLVPGWCAVKPQLVFRLVAARSELLQAAAANLLLFAPAALTMHVTLGQSSFLVVCCLGLLTVMPALVAMRVLGQTLHFHADAVAGLVSVPSAGAPPVGREPKPSGG